MSSISLNKLMSRDSIWCYCYFFASNWREIKVGCSKSIKIQAPVLRQFTTQGVTMGLTEIAPTPLTQEEAVLTLSGEACPQKSWTPGYQSPRLALPWELHPLFE